MIRTAILIDDDQDDLDVLRAVIGSIDETINCITFTSPLQAIRAITSELIIVPDFIITDINMPMITGDQCVRRLRTITVLEHTVIVVLSTTMQKDVAESLKSLGANFTLAKPNSIHDYRQILRPVFAEKL